MVPQGGSRTRGKLYGTVALFGLGFREGETIIEEILGLRSTEEATASHH
jgi:hypothetical protein